MTGHLPKHFDKDIANEENPEFENVIDDFPVELSNEDQTQRDQKYLEILNQPNETKCPQCDEIFNTLAAWGAHFQSAHEIKQFGNIPSSSSGKPIFDIDVGSTSQSHADKFDDIPVSTSGENVLEIDFDPPSPVYKVRTVKRIRGDSWSQNEDDDLKNVVLRSVADKIIEEVIIEELDEFCEDEFCDVHHKWISKVLKRHGEIREYDSKKKKTLALEK